ncbi:MAG: hypothetical protein SPG37_06625, partial [Eubacteriales bacterium]|nr:hypothetical protein [Eubacteriales bacterium]
MAKTLCFQGVRRDFGHAVSFFINSVRGIKPSPSYLMWMCCTRLPLDLSGENAASYRACHPVTLLADLLHLF